MLRKKELPCQLLNIEFTFQKVFGVPDIECGRLGEFSTKYKQSYNLASVLPNNGDDFLKSQWRYSNGDLNADIFSYHN